MLRKISTKKMSSSLLSYLALTISSTVTLKCKSASVFSFHFKISSVFGTAVAQNFHVLSLKTSSLDVVSSLQGRAISI